MIWEIRSQIYLAKLIFAQIHIVGKWREIAKVGELSNFKRFFLNSGNGQKILQFIVNVHNKKAMEMIESLANDEMHYEQIRKRDPELYHCLIKAFIWTL